VNLRVSPPAVFGKLRPQGPPVFPTSGFDYNRPPGIRSGSNWPLASPGTERRQLCPYIKCHENLNL
jgi:hypothetical protein